MLEAYQGKLNEEKCVIGSGRKISMFFFFLQKSYTKLRTFHYKFLHRRIATNDCLKKINRTNALFAKGK